MKNEHILLPVRKDEYLNILAEKIRNCKKCSLSITRNNSVLGAGDLNARLMFIGEAPGAEEDLKGIPFIGKSGQLLSRIISAMGLKREEVYITNILKCRPPNNRDPLPYEVENCLPYLFMQIDIVNPEIIVLLGRIAGISLFGKGFSLSKNRGQIMEFRGYKVITTFHPAYLLMNPRAKILTWEDMKKVLKELELPLPDKKSR